LLADLGCGSGILGIAAALLGWDRVVAVEYDPVVAAAARANAVRNGVEIDVRVADLAEVPAPPADLVVAYVPLPLHAAIAAQLVERPATLLASGVLATAADEAVAAYEAAGMRECERVELAGWACLTLTRAGSITAPGSP
jgi:ribosomal protein L11 methyltransferase